jgi:hypothetical protein
MRTLKGLVCVAALATGLATALAQSNVYSLNVVGYYNVTIAAGKLALLANQLHTTHNTLNYVIPTAADFTELYKYAGGFSTAVYYGTGIGGTGWDQPAWTLNPGEAAMVKDPGTGQTLTFVGEVLQGSLVNTLPVGLTYKSSMVPQQGTPADFMVPGESFDELYTYNNGYSTTVYYGTDVGGNGWDYDTTGNGPTIAVGGAFGYKKAVGNTSTSWVRNFTVQ